MFNTGSMLASNEALETSHRDEFDHLGHVLARRGMDIEQVVAQVSRFEVAVPSWALGTGGTRFGRFPGGGEPRDIFEKLDDIALIHRLTGAAPRVSLHIPWDAPDDPGALVQYARDRGLGFDAMNSNTFQDQEGQKLSYKFGSLCHTDPAVREQAIRHNLDVVDLGRTLGSKALTVWLADGSSYPGQMHLRRSYERTLDSLAVVYDHLPDDWKLFTEHKPYEPAFYATVVQDWGTSYLLAQHLGPRAACLVDLGHHLPNTNVELVVARLISAGKLGGFHFNDSKYGDDDLETGSIQPYRLFLVFNELIDAAAESAPGFDPAYMIDQSHNLKDPIEALLQTVHALQRACAQAWLVDREALHAYQESNDVLMAEMAVKNAFETDVTALIRECRLRKGGALDPIDAFRRSCYRQSVTEIRRGGTYVPPQSL